MIVTLQNPSVDGLEKTYLALSYNIGTTSIEVRNNQQFSNNQRILLGEPGMAYTEVVTTGSIGADGTTIAIGATLYAHEADTPVYLLQFDQVQFYRSTTGINGPYSLLATENIDFTAEDLQTTYNDLTAATGYYYEMTVYNSITTVESAFTDPIPAITGWARNQVGYIMDGMYTELSDANEDNLTRDEMLGYMNEVNDDLMAQVVRPYNFLYTREAFARVGGANTLAWPVNSLNQNAMWKFDHMDYNYTNTAVTPTINDTFTVQVVPLVWFRNRHLQNTSSPAVPSGLSIGLTNGGSLVNGKEYFYVVTATYSQGGESNPSVEVTATPSGSNLTVVLSWTSLPNVSGYNIYRGLSSGGELLLGTANAAATSFTDNGTLSPGTQAPPSPINLQDDAVQEMTLNEATQEFHYYPASMTSQSAVWYLYYYAYFSPLTTEGQYIQTPTPKIYKHYIKYKYYLKKASIDESYVPQYKQEQGDYVYERARLKSQDRRDVGTARRFGNEDWVYRSYNR